MTDYNRQSSINQKSRKNAPYYVACAVWKARHRRNKSTVVTTIDTTTTTTTAINAASKETMEVDDGSTSCNDAAQLSAEEAEELFVAVIEAWSTLRFRNTAKLLDGAGLGLGVAVVLLMLRSVPN